MGHGPPHGEVRRAVPALQPARFYAGNNGLLGFINFNGAFTGFAFSDFLLDLVSSKGRGGGDPDDPWTHLQNRISVFAQDDFKVLRNLTLNLGLRWAYTSPLVEEDNRQSNFDLATGRQIFAEDGGIEERALYNPYYSGFEPRLGAAWTATDRLVVRGGYGITQFMEGTGANLRLPLNPPFFFESAVNYDATTGRRHGPHRLRRAGAGHDAERQRARLRSGSAPAVLAAVERLRRVPADAGDVGAGRLRRPPRRSPGHAGRRQPGAAGRRRPRDVGAEEHTPAALRRVTARDHHRDDGGAIGQPVSLDAGERAPARVGRRRVPGLVHARQDAHEQSRLLRRVRRHRVAGRDERDRRRVLAEHLRSRGRVGAGVPRRPPQLRLFVHLRIAVRPGPRVRLRTGPARSTRSLAAGAWAASSRRVRVCPSPSPMVATARFRASEERSVPTASATRIRRISRSTAGSTSMPSRRRRSARSATARSASRARRATPTSI